jgi:dCTP deaminase
MIINGNSLMKAAPIADMVIGATSPSGKQYGLIDTGYDIRLKQTILFQPRGYMQYLNTQKLSPNVACNEYKMFGHTNFDTISIFEDDSFSVNEGTRFTLASAIEEFHMPNNLMGRFTDKSSMARRGISVFNTNIKPGWTGFLTLEIVFHGSEPVMLQAGEPIGHVIFELISDPVSYQGKYQDQENKPVSAK